MRRASICKLAPPALIIPLLGDGCATSWGGGAHADHLAWPLRVGRSGTRARTWQCRRHGPLAHLEGEAQQQRLSLSTPEVWAPKAAQWPVVALVKHCMQATAGRSPEALPLGAGPRLPAVVQQTAIHQDTGHVRARQARGPPPVDRGRAPQAGSCTRVTRP